MKLHTSLTNVDIDITNPCPLDHLKVIIPIYLVLAGLHLGPRITTTEALRTIILALHMAADTNATAQVVPLVLILPRMVLP